MLSEADLKQEPIDARPKGEWCLRSPTSSPAASEQAGCFPRRVTRRTEIVRQTAEGKRTPATRSDAKTAPADVWINFPSLLAAGDPPVVPATRIIGNPRAKKPR